MTSLKKKLHIAKNVLSNSIKVSEFSITNCCICKCSFCGIWKQKKKILVDANLAIKAIDKLAGFGVSHITLTGGEPLLHPSVVDFVRQCTNRNIHCSVLNADSRLVTEEKIKALKNAGLDLLSISLDSHDPKIVEQNRKVVGLMSHIEKAVGLAKKHKLKTMASAVIWTGNHNKMKELFDKANEIGFDDISINYPEISESGVYELGGEGVKLTKQQVIDSLKDIIKLKKQGYKVINITSSMEDIIRYLEDPKKVKYYCFGGYRVLFLDWFFDLYPCMHLGKKIGNLWDLEKSDLKKIKCNACNMSWYRDFSVYFHGFKSIRPIYESLFNQ